MTQPRRKPPSGLTPSAGTVALGALVALVVGARVPAAAQPAAPPVADERALARALAAEGVVRLQAKAYEQALANFLAAYAKVPGPALLLDIASTLRGMGRLSDAANTYQRYLLAPPAGSAHVAQVTDILAALDQQLTTLIIQVSPPGSRVSIDAGPFIAVGSSLQARVRPGIHLVRIEHGGRTDELTVHGFAGERKHVQLVADADGAPSPGAATAEPVATSEATYAWLDDSERYGVRDPASNERVVLARPGGVAIAPHMPRVETTEARVAVVVPEASPMSSGVVGVVRIDGEGRGVAGGVGLAIARDRFEADLMVLRSHQTGGYLGARMRILSGFFRPYVALGMPLWVFAHRPSMDAAEETRLGLGVRGAAGLELFINAHLSVQADIGYEHFWFVAGTPFDDSIVIPTVGVIGRL